LSRAVARAQADAELVRRCLAGEAEAFSSLIERYQQPMLASAHQMLGDPEVAVDCVQDAFIEAYRSLRNLRDVASFRAWLFGILRNRCRKYITRRKFTFVPIDEETDIAAPESVPPMFEAEIEHLRRVLHLLPERYREVLAARYLADMEYEEIAVALHTSVNNVRVRCCRARERLRQMLEGEPPGRTEYDDEPEPAL
jgi:RNA polymerase sigma-70 factor, ECF subfamily